MTLLETFLPAMALALAPALAVPATLDTPYVQGIRHIATLAAFFPTG